MYGEDCEVFGLRCGFAYAMYARLFCADQNANSQYSEVKGPVRQETKRKRASARLSDKIPRELFADGIRGPCTGLGLFETLREPASAGDR